VLFPCKDSVRSVHAVTLTYCGIWREVAMSCNIDIKLLPALCSNQIRLLLNRLVEMLIDVAQVWSLLQCPNFQWVEVNVLYLFLKKTLWIIVKFLKLLLSWHEAVKHWRVTLLITQTQQIKLMKPTFRAPDLYEKQNTLWISAQSQTNFSGSGVQTLH